MVHLDFKATNNMAEYRALIFGLSTTLSLGVKQLLVKGNSQLIIKKVRGSVVALILSWPPTCSMPRS
jgi:ribonuclease HI